MSSSGSLPGILNAHDDGHVHTDDDYAPLHYGCPYHDDYLSPPMEGDGDDDDDDDDGIDLAPAAEMEGEGDDDGGSDYAPAA